MVSALVELTRLPNMSIVEEKLHVREELIDWDAESKQKMVAVSAGIKLPFDQIQSLHNKLQTIINLQSERRAKVCQQLKSNSLIDEQVKAFAIADEKIVCSMTGQWVRDQCNRGSLWITNYQSVMATLTQYGHPGARGLPNAASSLTNQQPIDAKTIVELMEVHDSQQNGFSFSEQYNQLSGVKQGVMNWANAVHQVVVSDSLTLQERCQQLNNASTFRPKGINIDPPQSAINAWVLAFTWRLNLQGAIKSITDTWKATQLQPTSQIEGADQQEMLRLIRVVLAPLMVEGQDFLIATELQRPFVTGLINEALCSIQNNGGCRPIKKNQILESGIQGKAVMEHIFDTNTDCSLVISQRIFWIMLYQCFHARLGPNNFTGDLDDAKALLQLCPQGVDTTEMSSFMDTKTAEQNLQKLVSNAESLERDSSAILDQCSTLLLRNCFSQKDSLRSILLRLSDIESTMNSSELVLPLKLLAKSNIKKRVNAKIKGLTWLVNTFAYDLFFSDPSTPSVHGQHSTIGDRIHVNNLRDLYNGIPITIGSKLHVTGDCLDSEVVRVSLMVKQLWENAHRWQSRVAYLLEGANRDNIVDIKSLTALTEDEALSKVSMWCEQ